MYKFHKDIPINDPIVLNQMNRNIRNDLEVISFVYRIRKLDWIFLMMKSKRHLLCVKKVNGIKKRPKEKRSEKMLR